MSAESRHRLDEEMSRFERRLPQRAARGVRWLRDPSSRYVRIPASVGLIAGGAVGFLPIVGFWMIPLGVALIAQDVPVLRPPISRLLGWVNRKWPARAPEPNAKSD